MQSQCQTRSPRLKYRLPTTLVKGRHSLPSKHMHPLVLWCSLGVLREVLPALPDGAISFNLLETETQNPHVYSSKCLANSQTQPLAFAKLISPFISPPVLPLHLPTYPKSYCPAPPLKFRKWTIKVIHLLLYFTIWRLQLFSFIPSFCLPAFSPPPGSLEEGEISSELLPSESLLNGFILQLGTSREITMISLHLLFSGK